MSITPRLYQTDAAESVFRYWEQNTGNPLILMPGGTGKSVVIGLIIQYAFGWPGTRVMMLTHVQELIEQNLDKLLKLWPTAPAGVFASGLGRKEHLYPITLASIQSVHEKWELFDHIDFVLIDEAHLVSPKELTMYRKFIEGLKKRNPKLKIVGLSATGYRLGLGPLTDGGLFTDVCHDSTHFEAFNWYIDQGFLCPLVPKRTKYQIEVPNVQIVGGEYVLSQLQAAVDREAITRRALDEMMREAEDRNRWLIFGTGVEHCEHISAMLDEYGVSNVCIHNKLKPSERKQAFAAYRAGLVQAAVNNNILTTGTDVPEIDCIAVLRHTLSTALWVQMLSRGDRIAPWVGKRDCLVLDYAGNTARLGPINDPVLPTKPGKKKRPGMAPVRLCDNCGTYNHASARFCVQCGEEFSLEVRIKQYADSLPLIRRDEEPEVEPVVESFKVDHCTYMKHNGKRGKPPSLKVTYYCGFQHFREFICFEHRGIPRDIAVNWWYERSAGARHIRTPDTVDEALGAARSLRIPARVQVVTNRKWKEIVGYVYE